MRRYRARPWSGCRRGRPTGAEHARRFAEAGVEDSPLKPFHRPSFFGMVSAMKRALASVTVLLMMFLYAPILVVAVSSFHADDGATLRWYAELARDIADHTMGERSVPIVEAFDNSIAIAALTTVLSVSIGTAGAWTLYRWRIPGERIVNALSVIPLATPEIVIGVSLLVFFRLLHVDLGFLTIVASHTTFSIPFVLATIRARLADLDPTLEEAALDLGATPLVALLRVFVPYLAPAMLSSALLVFALSMDELIVSTFTKGPRTPTLPVHIYGMVRVGLTPAVDAVSTVLVVATVILVMAGERLRRINHSSQPSEAK